MSKIAILTSLLALAFFAGSKSGIAGGNTPNNRPWIAQVNVVMKDRSMTQGDAELLANRVVITILEDEWIANEIEDARVVRVRR